MILAASWLELNHSYLDQEEVESPFGAAEEWRFVGSSKERFNSVFFFTATVMSKGLNIITVHFQPFFFYSFKKVIQMGTRWFVSNTVTSYIFSTQSRWACHCSEDPWSTLSTSNYTMVRVTGFKFGSNYSSLLALSNDIIKATVTTTVDKENTCSYTGVILTPLWSQWVNTYDPHTSVFIMLMILTTL